MANAYTQIVNVGSSFEQTFIYKDGNERPIDVTGWGAVFRLRDDQDRVICEVRDSDSGDRSLAIDATNGQFDVSVYPSVTSRFDAKIGTFELEISQLGRVFRIADGAVSYRARGRALLANPLVVIRSTSNSVTIETQQVSSYQRIDRGPPGSRGPEGPTVLANSSRIGAIAQLGRGTSVVALDDQSAPVNCRHELSVKSFSSINAMVSRAKELKSCLCRLEPGVNYSEGSIDFQGGEGIVLDLGAHGNYNGGILTLTASSGPVVDVRGTLNCGLRGGQIAFPNLGASDSDTAISFEGITSDVSGSFLENIGLIGSATLNLTGTSTTSTNVTTNYTNYLLGPITVNFTVQAGLNILLWQKCQIVSRGSGASMTGAVVSYSGTTLVLRPTQFSGSGAHTDWDVYIRRVPHGVTFGGVPGVGTLHAFLKNYTGIRLRSYVRCTGYMNDLTVMNQAAVECELATYWNPTGQDWDIIGGTTQPTADGRGREIDYDTTSARVTGLTIQGGWHGDLDGVHDTGPWLNLYDPQGFTIAGGLWQGQTGAALRLRGGKGGKVFQGSDFQCAYPIDFVGPETSTGIEVYSGSKDLAITSMHTGMGSYGSRVELVGSDFKYYYGNTQTNGTHVVANLAIDGSQVLSMSGDVYAYALNNSGAIEASSSADGQKLGSIQAPSAPRAFMLINVGTHTIVLPNNDATELNPAYRWALPGGNITLASGDGVWVWYSNQVNRWRAIRA